MITSDYRVKLLEQRLRKFVKEGRQDNTVLLMDFIRDPVYDVSRLEEEVSDLKEKLKK